LIDSRRLENVELKRPIETASFTRGRITGMKYFIGRSAQILERKTLSAQLHEILEPKVVESGLAVRETE